MGNEEGLEEFKVHARNMDIKGNSGENSERREENWRENFHRVREYINNYEENVGRNVGIKEIGEVPDGNEKHIKK